MHKIAKEINATTQIEFCAYISQYIYKDDYLKDYIKDYRIEGDILASLNEVFGNI